MNPSYNPAAVLDYYAHPVCSEDVADAAYRSFLEQRCDSVVDFGRWLEAEAWRRTSPPRNLGVDS